MVSQKNCFYIEKLLSTKASSSNTWSNKHICRCLTFVRTKRKKKHYVLAATPYLPTPALFGHEEMQTGQSVHFLPGPWPVQTSGQKGPLSRWDKGHQQSSDRGLTFVISRPKERDVHTKTSTGVYLQEV